jgi:coenzyme PQQ precursor peptide PqqA
MSCLLVGGGSPEKPNRAQWTRLVEACTGIRHALNSWPIIKLGNPRMVWTTPTLEEICIGLEINGYLPAEF